MSRLPTSEQTGTAALIADTTRITPTPLDGFPPGILRPPSATANRLGFAVKVLARPGMKANDARRWQSGPHLEVSIGYLDAIFDLLDATGIRMYRISSRIRTARVPRPARFATPRTGSLPRRGR